jgi:hypothetical protein
MNGLHPMVADVRFLHARSLAAFTARRRGLQMSRIRSLNRPRRTRLDRGMPWLVRGTPVLEPPNLDLAEQRKC